MRGSKASRNLFWRTEFFLKIFDVESVFLKSFLKLLQSLWKFIHRRINLTLCKLLFVFSFLSNFKFFFQQFVNLRFDTAVNSSSFNILWRHGVQSKLLSILSRMLDVDLFHQLLSGKSSDEFLKLFVILKQLLSILIR